MIGRVFQFRVGVLALLTVGAGILSACSDSTSAPAADAGKRDVGVLQFVPTGVTLADAAGADSSVTHWNSPPAAGVITPSEVIDVADTVVAGEAVSVTVHTVLPDGCWSTDGQDVSQSGSIVDVTPQDKRSDAAACTLLYGWGNHTFQVTFASAGTATIRVNGRRIHEGDDVSSEPLTAERSVVVRDR